MPAHSECRLARRFVRVRALRARQGQRERIWGIEHLATEREIEELHEQ
jgi:hypothetical protein